MLVKVTVQGEDDAFSFTKVFQYGIYDDNVFVASVKKVKETLDRNLRINIDQALLVFISYVVNSLKTGKSRNEIKEQSSKILSHEQVMIGVPEMMQKLDFDVKLDDQSTVISINRPIPIPDYVFKSL